jgi:replicative DNA helicase
VLAVPSADTRVVPHDLAAERSVLGAVLVDNGLFPVAYALVQPADFFRDAYRRIWAACARLDAARQVIDPITLRDALATSGEIEKVGGMAEIGALIEGVPRAVNVESYARIVRDKARLRQLIAVGTRIVDEAYGSDEPAEILARAESLLVSAGRQAVGGSVITAADWMQAVLGHIERNTVAAAEGRSLTGVPTGFRRLDEMTRGLQPSHFVLIGARTGIGKTSIGLQMALAGSQTHMGGYWTMEMSADEIGYRAISTESNVDAFRLQNGNISGWESKLVGQAAAAIGERRLVISDAPQSLYSLCSEIRRLVLTDGLQFAFVDYLGLIEGPQAENRTQVVSTISRKLKALAMELRIPVVALAQLSREAVKGNERPQLHHFKESGSLEQDCNVALLLHRVETPDDGSQRMRDNEEAELIVAKNRGGPKGLVKLLWRASLTKFVEPEAAAPSGPVQGAFA